jgi:hypothetical protein
MIVKSFTAAMIDYFGKKPNQSNTEFLLEMKKLDAACRAYFTKLLEAEGFQITN